MTSADGVSPGSEKTLESPLDSRSNQSILKEISPKYSLEGVKGEDKRLMDAFCWERLTVRETGSFSTGLVHAL